MSSSRERRAIDLAMRCYPAPWRLRHGDEARWLATALLDDGVSWWSISTSFLGGAVKERVARAPSVRVGAALATLAIGAAAIPLAILTSFTPASATSTNVVIVISKPADAARQLESAFAAHHFGVTVTERTAPARLSGSILSVSTSAKAVGQDDVIRELRGKCSDGAFSCTYGLSFPRHFSGRAHVTIGRTAP